MGYIMTILIDKLTLAKAAAVGTVVGTLAMYDETGTVRKANWLLEEGAAGFFGMSGASIVTLRTPFLPGLYCVNLEASAQFIRYSDNASFTVVVS
jgi:hypothetical protein